MNVGPDQTQGTASTTGNTTGGSGDMLDKGVNAIEQRTGHEQKPQTTEKVLRLLVRINV